MQENSRFAKNFGRRLHRKHSGCYDVHVPISDLSYYKGPSGTTPDGFIVRWLYRPMALIIMMFDVVHNYNVVNPRYI